MTFTWFYPHPTVSEALLLQPDLLSIPRVSGTNGTSIQGC